MEDRTRFLRACHATDPATGAANLPIHQTSTFAQEDPERLGAWNYARSGNPTRDAAEHAIAVLEGGERGLAFASGMAAISSALLLFAPGDHLIVSRDVYGGTYRVLTTLFERWGLATSFVDTTDPGQVRAAVTPRTRAVYVETPSNPLLTITDLAALAALAREHGLLALVDNTFMTPYLQRPLELGFDLVLHSATKFLGGHSDLVAGLAVARTADLGERLYRIQNSFGAVLAPHDAWLLLRGMKTLAPRLEAQQKTAALVAGRLQHMAGVTRVFYPGLASHPGRAVHQRQARGAGAVLSFELASEGLAHEFLRRLTLPMLAVSLGGVESIVSYPVTMSHAAMPPAERERRGVTSRLVRLSVGLETADDLMDDVARALASARTVTTDATPSAPTRSS